MELDRNQAIRPPLSLFQKVLSFFRDVRVIQAITQIIFTVAFFTAVYTLSTNVYNSLIAQGSIPSFSFLSSRAGFDLLETPEWYSAESTYSQALQVGIINTLRVVVIGLVLSTILGVLTGIALLSRNWLVRNLSSAYVEILRNTPLLVQLIFWYYVFMLEVLPRDGDDLTFPAEGIAVFPLRVILYPVLWLIIWALSRQRHTLKGILTGALYGAVLIELVQLLLGYSPLLFVGVGLVGVVVFAIGFTQQKAVPSVMHGAFVGAGLVAVGQMALVALLGTLTNAEIIAADGALWTPVYSVLYLSRKAVAIPELIQTVSFNFWFAIVVLSAAVAAGTFVYFSGVIERTGRNIPRFLIAAGIVLVGMLFGWIFASNAPDTLLASPIWSIITTLGYGVLLIVVLFTIVDQASLRMTKGLSRLIRIGLMVAVVGGGSLLLLQQVQAVLANPVPNTLEEGFVLENNRPVEITELQESGRFLARHEAQVSQQPLVVGIPIKRGTRFQQGVTLSPEYLALTLGLIIYTSAFIGEIVRAGIQAVSFGQFEAARALGLNGSQTLQMIILPQALRVIIPPLGNQYLNLAKNSSLASAVAFADVYSIGQTVMNQSGQSIPGFFLILITYLIMSLIIALLMNVVNSRFQLVTR